MPYHGLRDPDQLQALLDAVLSIESDLELSGVLHRIVESACSLTDATYGALGVINPTGKGLIEFVQVGIDSASAARIGHMPEGAGILGVLIVDPRPLRLSDLSAHPDAVGLPSGHPPMQSFLGVPLLVRGEVYGNLYLTNKKGAREFTAEDERLIVSLAAATGFAVANARLHAHVADLTLSVDRERIARDLHDTVIQRLFATGLSLQSVLAVAEPDVVRRRIEDAVRDLDDTIRQVRTTIFALDPPPTAETGVRLRVLEVCSEASRALGFEPEVRFAGPIDLEVRGDVATHLLASLREALSNVARHAHASSALVEVSATSDIVLRVTDDGVGRSLDPSGSGSGSDSGMGSDSDSDSGNGLRNMSERAQLLGGSFACEIRGEEGTVVTWRVPPQRH